MDIKAVVFDMDGVIFDSEIKVVECWEEIASKYNIPNIKEACSECLGLNARATKEKMLLRYGKDFPYDDFKKEMSELFHSRYDNGRLPMKPGVESLLEYLKKNDYKIALASSTRREVVERELADAGIIKYFDEIICGDMVKRSKPDPEIFIRACLNLDVPVHKAIAIEDSYNGIRAAYKAGMYPVMVPDLAPVTEEMEMLAYMILPSLDHVREFMEEGIV